MALRDCALLEEEFPTVRQWDLCTVLQDEGMVAFYEEERLPSNPY